MYLPSATEWVTMNLSDTQQKAQAGTWTLSSCSEDKATAHGMPALPTELTVAPNLPDFCWKILNAFLRVFDWITLKQKASQGPKNELQSPFYNDLRLANAVSSKWMGWLNFFPQMVLTSIWTQLTAKYIKRETKTCLHVSRPRIGNSLTSHNSLSGRVTEPPVVVNLSTTNMLCTASFSKKFGWVLEMIVVSF